jgi:hypothetical protein
MVVFATMVSWARPMVTHLVHAADGQEPATPTGLWLRTLSKRKEASQSPTRAVAARAALVSAAWS